MIVSGAECNPSTASSLIICLSTSGHVASGESNNSFNTDENVIKCENLVLLFIIFKAPDLFKKILKVSSFTQNSQATK